MTRAGYTLVELMVMVVVITILIAGTSWIDSGVRSMNRAARDSERSSDVSSVALIFEGYYRDNPTAAGPSYPTTTQVTNSLDTIVENPELLTPPTADTPAFTAASSSATQTPTDMQYIYQPFTTGGVLCTTAPCVRFTLFYKLENDTAIKTIESRHQQ